MVRKLMMVAIMTFIVDRYLKIYCAMWALSVFLVLQITFQVGLGGVRGVPPREWTAVDTGTGGRGPGLGRLGSGGRAGSGLSVCRPALRLVCLPSLASAFLPICRTNIDCVQRSLILGTKRRFAGNKKSGKCSCSAAGRSQK